MFHRVLATTDFSEASLDAVREAASLAQHGELAVCHVIPDAMGIQPLFAVDTQVDVQALLDFETRVREELARRIDETLGELSRPVTPFVTRGEPYAEILRQAEVWNADLIVTGGHGKSGLSRVLLGRIAERVVRHAPSPVLVVRKAERKGVVLAATDLSDPALPAVAAGAAEARRRGARFVLLHVIDVWPDVYAAAAGGLLGAIGALPPPTLIQAKRQVLLETLKTALDREQIAGEPLVLQGEPAKTIVVTAEELGAELIVVGTHGRTGIARLALGSVAERVVRTAPSSVLAVRLGSV